MTDPHQPDDTQEIPPQPPERERLVYRQPERREEHVAQRETVYRSAWSPAQIVALIGGIFFIVLGGIALARAGFAGVFDHVEVGGFHHTPVLALVELVLGILLLAMGAIPGVERSGLIFIGGLSIALGIVFAVQGESFHRVLGTHRNTGLLYLLFGGILVVVALAAPVVLEDRSRTVYGRGRR